MFVKNAKWFYDVGQFCLKRRWKFLGEIISTIIFLLFNSIIPLECKIGKDTVFAYNGIGVVIHKNVSIGKRCVIGQNVTIGGVHSHPGIPSIGNRVYIGAGARILGPVIVGDDVIIGANSVVVKNIPPRCIVAGVPAKIIKQNISAKESRRSGSKF